MCAAVTLPAWVRLLYPQGRSLLGIYLVRFANLTLFSFQRSASPDVLLLVPSLDLPAAPGNPVAIRNTNTSVVVTWGASKDVKRLVGYYIECSQAGTNIWMPCNNKPIKETRSASFTLIPSLEIQKS